MEENLGWSRFRKRLATRKPSSSLPLWQVSPQFALLAYLKPQVLAGGRQGGEKQTKSELPLQRRGLARLESKESHDSPEELERKLNREHLLQRVPERSSLCQPPPKLLRCYRPLGKTNPPPFVGGREERRRLELICRCRRPSSPMSLCVPLGLACQGENLR